MIEDSTLKQDKLLVYWIKLGLCRSFRLIKVKDDADILHLSKKYKLYSSEPAVQRNIHRYHAVFKLLSRRWLVSLSGCEPDILHNKMHEINPNMFLHNYHSDDGEEHES